ncbi:hypothetical protein BY996DRAFT_4589609 [Phakopsora pachyrhizi]|uniref:Glycosyltransferase family 31 protein n=1 Tax=Phakopsora pachyrhizi TaxID=170000 RepID=A0AAV0AQH8_PHAPC|nr:hypothetical protein BY996DRAFT_4597468 [Phakopsora pachyrhizi]KAI8449207.1 hypothetical protein BY996DRAFT_4589609 [Phakopsora pachyrhizi]CAH7670190.1 hypothetical protein PPACK8108_LOCUS4904 [Phakopsora pachyrhizi]
MPNSYSQNLNSTNSNNSPHRSKRYWFSSRRQKRKNSIHALSATSSSSSASLYSPPFFSDQSASKLDDQAPKYSSLVSSSPNSGQPRRSSNGRLRRLSRFFPFILFSKLFSFRWFKKSISPYQPLGILLGTVGFIVFAISLTNFLIHFLDTDKEPLPWRSYCQEQPEFPHALADSLDPVNVFVGVFSIDSGYERRHLIRSTYARHSRPVDPRTGLVDHNVQLKFILGRPRIQHARRVALEMETYNDIVILDIAENMNRGKTFAYFSWASQNATVPFYYHQVQEPEPKTGINGIGGVKAHDPNNSQNLKLAVGFKKADFVVKADDDAFIVLSELERHLRVAPRTKTYWGYLIRNLFMGGECYALSSDLVRYVATSERVLDHLTGAEDKKVAKWMRIHPNATQINWVTERCWIYDHPKAGTTYSHGFLFPDEVERVRAEGRRGLTEAEIEERGEANLQSYSTVAKWKQRYVAPKNMMTMEEEVEALVEGGGRFQSSSLKRPVMPSKDLVPAEKVVFEADDQRLKKSNSITNKSTTKGLRSRVEEMGHYNEPVKNHYEEPSLKFGRPPSELMAHMPELENMPESELKEALIKARESKIVSKEEKFQKGSVGTVKLAEMPSQTQGVADSLSGTMLFAPTLRYDPDDIRLRNQRYLNRPHGGTVVVHYLKRNEWFLETSLVLLGKTKTWDDGLVPGAYGPHLREPSEKAKGTVVLGLDNMEDGSNQSSLTALGSKKVEVDNKIDWGKLNEVEEVPAGAGVFGGARMYGSPVILADGRIKEGRVISPSQRAIAETDFKVRQKMTDGDYRDSELGKASNTLEIVEDEEEEEGLKNIDGIRKSQFGGAGWIRGKPRVRVGDPANGPNFDLIKDQPESETNRGEEDGQRKDSVEEDGESNFEGINEEVAETQEVLKQILLKPTSIGGGSVVRSASELYNGVKVKS